MTKTPTLAIVALVLTACGSSDGTPPSATDLASDLGCTFHDTSDELFIKQGGPCGTVTVYTFSGDDTRDSWLKVAENFGGVYLVGDGWVITGKQAQLEAAKAKVGGSIQ
jgi:hypothetical protein